ncbi:O-unit flippase [Thioalkalivibrio denitrificans]|uniref:O-unit flippase n=1 Tax=Thioalkalivibrio denitrificans TaxID=108003 RepID=A0A1V3NHS2_9GAMM|nr:flippase [Thioalkalivibrio denitrificans]OOG24428.1 O-unit flippase [Thioalkalivibrio denitrificans]
MNLIPAFIHRRIAHRPNLVKIVDNIGWLFFDKFLRMGVGLFVGVWIARYLGPDQFGLLSFAMALVGLFGAIAGLGLQGIVVRDIVRDPACKEETLGTAAVLQLIGGLIAYGLILGFIFWLRPEDTLAKILVAILGAVTLFKASDVAVYWFESQVQSKYTVWVQNSAFMIFSAIKIALILNNAPLVTFAWAMMAEALVVAAVLFVILGLRGPKLQHLYATLARAKRLLCDSWPLLLSGMVLMVQARIDQVMLGQMVGDYEVAQYSVALRIIETAAVSALILKSTFTPTIIGAKDISNESYLTKLSAFYKLNALVAISIALPIAILSYPIVSLLFGADYVGAAPVLALMTLRLFFAHIGVPRGIFLLSENLLTYSAVTMIVGTIFNILLNYLLIPEYGAMGATFASLLSFAITIILIDILYRRTRMNTMLMLRSTITCGSLLRRRSWVL